MSGVTQKHLGEISNTRYRNSNFANIVVLHFLKINVVNWIISEIWVNQVYRKGQISWKVVIASRRIQRRWSLFPEDILQLLLGQVGRNSVHIASPTKKIMMILIATCSPSLKKMYNSPISLRNSPLHPNYFPRWRELHISKNCERKMRQKCLSNCKKPYFCCCSSQNDNFIEGFWILKKWPRDALRSLVEADTQNVYHVLTSSGSLFTMI